MLNKLTYFVQREPVTLVPLTQNHTQQFSNHTSYSIQIYSHSQNKKHLSMKYQPYQHCTFVSQYKSKFLWKHLLWTSPKAETPRLGKLNTPRAGSGNAASHSSAQQQWAFLIHLLQRAAAAVQVTNAFLSLTFHHEQEILKSHHRWFCTSE